MLDFIFVTSVFLILDSLINFMLAIAISTFKEVRYNKNHYEDRMNSFFYWLLIISIIMLLTTNIIVTLIPLDYGLPASTIIIFIAEAIVYHVATKEVEKA